MGDDASSFHRFLETLWADHEKGTLRRLSDYLQEFPEDEERIAREYISLVSEIPETDDEERIGPYRIIREIGRGGQAVVYLAEDPRLKREVALKVMRSLAAMDSKAARRFQREAEIVGRLTHPGICPVFDAGWELSTPYIAMQYIDGRTLGRLISDHRAGGEAWFTELVETKSEVHVPLPHTEQPEGPQTVPQINRVLSLMEEICRIVHFAHEQGVVHRDLKPGNVMITDEDRPVVLDFGLARSEAPSDDSLTTRGGYLGTRVYMSPEQLLARPVRADRRTDIWSLGVTLFECLTIRRPFEGATESAINLAIQSHPVPEIRRLNPAVSKDLKVVVETALEKDRERRYQTAEALAEDLRRVREFEPILARPAGPVLRTRRWVRRNRAVAASLLVVFVALATAVVISQVALHQTTLANERNQRLADLRRVVDLKAWADHLWPMRPEVLDGAWGLDAWLAEARQVVQRLPEHDAALAELSRESENEAPDPAPDDVVARRHPMASRLLRRLRDRRARMGSGGARAEDFTGIDALIAEVAREVPAAEAWRHDATTAGWIRRNRGAISAALDSLPELIQQIEARRAIVLDVVSAHEESADAWKKASLRIREHESYGGLNLEPIEGLVPLGPDPLSGLEEFALVGTGAIPVRDGGDEVSIADDTAVIMVLLPGGEYSLGSVPQPGRVGSPVTVLAPFLLGKYEITRGQWRRLMGEPGTEIRVVARLKKPLTEAHPVDGKDWFQSVEYCRRAGVELPTEVQWEYASRAGTTTRWPCGDRPASYEGQENLADSRLRDAHPDITSSNRAADWDDGYVATAPVGYYLPNDFGLFDMGGNVTEWCLDRYERDLPKDGGDAPDGLHLLSRGRARVNRGGNWLFPPHVCTSTLRQWDMPQLSTSHLGFRVALRVVP